jgi:molybdopterin molybdotransferase
MTDPASHAKHTDVRMKGFASRSTVDEAIAWIDSVLPDRSQLPAEQVLLTQANARILSQDVSSTVNVPGFARAMMDGYALHAEETHGASPSNPLKLHIAGTCLPGTAFSGVVAREHAVRIMTGAPMPTGADAVLPVEFTESQDVSVFALGEVASGKNVGTVGEDVQKGAVVLHAGRILRPQDMGVLSSIGCNTVNVVKRPRVRIVISGNELLPSGSIPSGYQIADANGPMLYSLVSRDGGEPIMSSIVPDTEEALLAAMTEPADIVLVSGGSSVGKDDHAPRLLSQHGTLAIHGIAMRPSSPAGMGQLNDRLVFLLPGNPVSCLCAYDFFAGRAIRALGGNNRDWPYRRMTAKLSRKLVSTVGRVDYARVKVEGTHAEPLAISGASILTSTTIADGFVIVPADCEGYAADSEVEVLLY